MSKMSKFDMECYQILTIDFSSFCASRFANWYIDKEKQRESDIDIIKNTGKLYPAHECHNVNKF